MIERDALSRLNHPNIVKLHYTFQDKTNLYFALDFCPNGDLYEMMQKIRNPTLIE